MLQYLCRIRSRPVRSRPSGKGEVSHVSRCENKGQPRYTELIVDYLTLKESIMSYDPTQQVPPPQGYPPPPPPHPPPIYPQHPSPKQPYPQQASPPAAPPTYPQY